MKNIDDTVNAILILLDNAENDFERHKIELLMRDLTAPPEVLNPNAPGIEKICPQCGKIFHTKKKLQKFCSRSCSASFNKNARRFK